MQVVLYETKYWKAVLSDNQYYLCRSFIVYKGEATHLSELSSEVFLDLKDVIDTLESAITKAFGATHYNWTCLMNDYYKPKNREKEKELHLHLWVRYEDEVEFEGQIFKDEVFGHHYDKTKEKLVSDELLRKIAERVSTFIPPQNT